MMAFKKYCVDSGRAAAVNSSFVMGLPFGDGCLSASIVSRFGKPTNQAKRQRVSYVDPCGGVFLHMPPVYFFAQKTAFPTVPKN